MTVRHNAKDVGWDELAQLDSLSEYEKERMRYYKSVTNLSNATNLYAFHSKE